jgi:hypothetical protein
MRVVVCIASVLVTSLSACDQPPYIPPAEETDTAQPDTAQPDTDGETVLPNCNIEPKLSDINAKYFSQACTFGGCHESDSQEGDLNLEAPSLHAVLVNVPAADSKAGPRGKIRVVPGDPVNSFLVQKLEGTMARDEGNIMPDGADEPIDPACRIRMVRQWITDGALDN